MGPEPTLLEMLAIESDPELRKVLECYRGAQIELDAAAHQLEKMGRYQWSLAATTRARDVEWQVQRYMSAEGAPVVKLYDFADDAPTNPRGYPRFTGLSEQLEPETTLDTIIVDQTASSPHAVFDTDRAPPPSAIARRERILNIVLNVCVAVVLVLAIYAVAKSR